MPRLVPVIRATRVGGLDMRAPAYRDRFGRSTAGRRGVPRLDAMRATMTRTLRAVRLVIRDGRIPRPLRWAGGLGLLPVPGPFDEIVLLVVAGVLWLGYRDQLSEASQKAAAP